MKETLKTISKIMFSFFLMSNVFSGAVYAEDEETTTETPTVQQEETTTDQTTMYGISVDWEQEDHPDSMTVYLVDEDENLVDEAELNEENDWGHIFEGLNPSKKYRLKRQDVKGWTNQGTDNASSMHPEGHIYQSWSMAKVGEGVLTQETDDFIYGGPTTTYETPIQQSQPTQTYSAGLLTQSQPQTVVSQQPEKEEIKDSSKDKKKVRPMTKEEKTETAVSVSTVGAFMAMLVSLAVLTFTKKSYN